MSTHYLIDLFTPAGTVIDVTSDSSGQSSATGALVIRIPSGVAIHGKPQNLTDLNNAKATGLLGFYAGFANIAFDPCLTGGIDSGASSKYFEGTGLCNHCILDTGVLTTSQVTLSAPPSVCVVTWEAYSFVNDDPSSGRVLRTYTEQDAGGLGCEIAFDGLASTTAFDGVATNIAPADQGVDVVLTFTNTSGSRIYLGSWAVIY